MKKHFLTTTAIAVMLATTVLRAGADDPFAELDAATAEPSSTAASEQQNRDEFQEYLQAHQNEFADYRRKLMEEFDEYQKIAQQETEKFQNEIGKVWDQPELSSKKVWVDYSQDLKTRSKVDFENKTISISTTVPKGKSVSDAEVQAKLKGLLTKDQAQAFADDKVAQAVEKKSREKLTLLQTAEVKPEPILMPLVSDEPSPDEKKVDTIVSDLLKKKSQKTETNSRGETVVTVEVPYDAAPKEDVEERAPEPAAESDTSQEDSATARVMADLRLNKIPKGAREVANYVQDYSQRSKVDQSLVFAVIETESAFNPMAKSPIPAYGLMQIVPGSAGVDATEQLFGKGKILSPSYLYTRDKNIEIGATYLNILYYRYLAGVENPLSRLYCSIAAYNTGAGNVARAFTGNKRLRDALPKINALTPQQVYDHLIDNLPYEETRNYLRKVVSRMPKYAI